MEWDFWEGKYAPAVWGVETWCLESARHETGQRNDSGHKATHRMQPMHWTHERERMEWDVLRHASDFVAPVRSRTMVFCTH